MKKTLLTACVLATLGMATAAAAGETIRLENCGRMADSFSFVVDTSGSMMQRIGDVKADSQEGQKRIEVAKAFIAKTAVVVMQKTDWQSSVYSVAPFAELVKLENRTSEDFQKALEERLNTNLEVFGRPTWLGQRGAAKLGTQLDHAQAFVVLATLGMATAAAAGETIRLENCGRMADSFSFVVDTSGSMMQRIGDVKADSQEGQKRIEVAKAFIAKTAVVVMQKTDWQSSVYSVAPFAELVKLENRTSEDFQKALEERLNTNLEVFGRPTWLGQRGAAKLGTQLDHAQAFVIITDGAFDAKTEGKTSPVKALQAFCQANPKSSVTIVSAAYSDEEKQAIITDGAFDAKTEGKTSPVKALQAFCQANPKSSVTIVSAAYSDEEKQAIEALVAANPKIQSYELDTLMGDESAFTAFVERVFYRDCSKVATVEIQDVYFDFDKSTLREESRTVLDEAVNLIRQMKPERDVTIAGWTDWTGSDEYNAGLSQRRAQAVKDYFVQQGLNLIRQMKPERDVTIAGWTDWTGSDEYNAGLSQRRAQAVKDYFVQQGLDVQRLESVGRGESYKYDNHSKQGRQLNRRVELLFGDSLQ